MILEWIAEVGAGLMLWFISLFPTADPSLGDFLVTFDNRVNEVLGLTSGMGAWLDFGFALTVASLVIGVWLIALAIRGIRWIISFIPTMSGGT